MLMLTIDISLNHGIASWLEVLQEKCWELNGGRWIMILRFPLKFKPLAWGLNHVQASNCELRKVVGWVKSIRQEVMEGNFLQEQIPSLHWIWDGQCNAFKDAWKIYISWWSLWSLLQKKFPYTNFIHWSKRCLANHTSWGKPWHVCWSPHGEG